jgi:hypothetical protein
MISARQRRIAIADEFIVDQAQRSAIVGFGRRDAASRPLLVVRLTWSVFVVSGSA